MRLSYIVFLAATLSASCGNNDEHPAAPDPVPHSNEPANISYQVIKEYPHDTLAFTEGLEYVNGKFYESVGLKGHSDIRITDAESGKLLKSTKLDKMYFGEGLTVLNGKAYQLTYQENTAFVYDPVTLKPLAKFSYNFGEGYGMTNDGKQLIISTGSSNLYFVNPSNFRVIKTVGVSDQYGPVAAINELEYIKGFVYANIWQKDIIIKIDPASGRIVGKSDFTSFRARYGYPSLEQGREGEPEVLNGIAWDSANNRIFITGKYWPKIFEVKLDN